MTIEERVTYQSYMITYHIVEDEEVKKEMGRRVLKPDYDALAKWLYEGMPPEIRGEFAQKFLSFDPLEVSVQNILGVDSPEEGVQKLLGVDSLEEAVLKLARTKEQQKQLLEFLRQNLEENGEG